MAAGDFDANGIWQYGSSDPLYPFAALLNKLADSVTDVVGDILSSRDAAWVAWTPALTASITAPTLGTGSITEGRYRVQGKTVHVTGTIRFGTASVAAGSGTYRLSLPVAPSLAFRSNSLGIGTVLMRDANTSSAQVAAPDGINAGYVTLWAHGGTGNVGAAAPWTWAAQDRMSFAFTYEKD